MKMIIVGNSLTICSTRHSLVKFKHIYLQTNTNINRQYRHMYIQTQWNHDESRGLYRHSTYE